MAPRARLLIAAALAALLPACSGAGLLGARVDGRAPDAIAEGNRLLADGLDLQEKARALRAEALANRRQADALDRSGEFERATRLRDEADRQEAEATETEYRGRDREIEGRDLLNRATGGV